MLERAVSDIAFVGSDYLPPESYLQPRRYRVLALCTRCGQKFSWITTKHDGKDRPCPRRACIEARHREDEAAELKGKRNIAKIIRERRAPGRVGSHISKAVDFTAEMIQREYGFTDLQDNLREGDIVAPKIRPDLQAAADNMFKPNPTLNINAGGRKAPPLQLSAMAKVVNSGALSGMSINPAIVNAGRMPGEPALRSVRSVKVGQK